jgi:hypothetical protein
MNDVHRVIYSADDMFITEGYSLLFFHSQFINIMF